MKTLSKKLRKHSAICFFALLFGSDLSLAAGPATMVTPFSRQTSIQPDTVFCAKGSDVNPTSYCADSTPCKTKTGATGKSYQVCLAGTANPPAGALILSSACWDMKLDFTCLQYVSDCSTYTSDPKCTEVGTAICITQTPTTMAPGAASRVGSCLAKTRHFSCIDQAAVTNPPFFAGCDTSSSLDGLNWSTHADSAANDFIQVATSAEIARQLATYGDKTGSQINGLFPGADLRCRNKFAGLNNCCNEKPSGTFTNSQVALKTGLVVSGFKQGASYAMKFGSPYVQDFAMNSVGTFAEAGSAAMFNSMQSTAANWSSFTSTFGVYGFGFSASGAASGVGSTLGLYSSSSSIALGQSGIYFNPYAFAIAIGIQIVMEVMSCNQDEKDLANQRKDNLCKYIGDYCSWEMKLLGKTIACLETTSTYCCYNGMLGKVIEEGAHSQLGLPWGGAKNPSCGGLTPDQLSSLDFTTPVMKAALKPFQDKIMKTYQSNMTPSLNNGTIKADVKAKSTATSSALCLQRKKFDSSTVCN